MTSRGCMYTAQGSLLCGKQLEHFEEEQVEQPVYEGYYQEEEEQPVYEGYYQEEEEQPVYEGYYQEEEEQPVYEGYYQEDAEMPVQEEYYNIGQDLYNAGKGMINTATQPFQRGPATRRF